jgi:hypothetical protein
MQTITTIGFDIAKSVFQVGVDAAGQVVIRRQLKRRYVLAFFQKLTHVWSVSKPAPRRTIGRGSSRHLVTFGMFLDAANKSLASIPLQTTEVSKKALSFTEQNMKAAFDHAKQVVQTTDLQEAMRIQSEFLKTQFTNASEQIKKITGEVMSAAKDATKDKS